MTKIYLVVFQNENENIYDFEVFTNKKKAQQYKRYWNAIMKNDQLFKGHTITIVQERINNWDFTKAADVVEKVLLPY